MACYVRSLPVWTSMFSSVVSVVPLSLRFSFLVNPLLFIFDSCHDLTPVVTDLLRRLALHFRRWDQTAAEERLRVVRRSLIISAGGRNPARYCASNARKAAPTVDPM